MIRDFAGTQQRVQYIDVASAMLGAQENLPDDLFIADGLHPNAKCYALCTSIIKPILLKRFADQLDVRTPVKLNRVRLLSRMFN
jgi:hypothetical protein